ncbi:hypothetical protein BJ165DRAFT_1456892 [Panaeolus papilionaceus]|nr:hypothetical protein BJ165DRAFT_1456892 [Panaeolus papilionaceus]
MPLLFHVLDPERLRLYYDCDDLGLIEELAALGKYATHVSLLWPQDSEGKFLGTKKVITKVMRVIELCPNLEDIALSQNHCWVGRMSHVKLVDVHPVLESLKELKQLTGVCEGMTKTLLKSPVYLNLTHLDVVSHVDVKILLEFKNLTHLYLENTAYRNKDTSFS